MQEVSQQEEYHLGQFVITANIEFGEKRATFTIVNNSKEEAEKLQDQLLQREQLRHPHFVALLSTKTNTVFSWCSAVYSLQSTFEYLSLNLEKEIAKRSRESLNFSGHELLSLLSDLVDVLSFLQRSKVIHYNICPALIYLKAEPSSGLLRAKLFESMNSPSSKKTTVRTLLDNDFGLYFDPAFFEWHAGTDRPLTTENDFRFPH